jgi:integrase
MPRQYKMTWLPNRLAWRKMFRGKVYQVSTRQLEEQGHEVLAHTKDGSRIAANGWWRQMELKLAACSRPPQRPLLPMEDVFAAHLGVPPEDVNNPALTDDLYEVGPGVDPRAGPVASIPGLGGELNQAAMRVALGDFLVRHLMAGEPLPEQFAALLPPARVQQITEGAKLLRGEPAAPGQDINAHADAFLKGQELRMAAGDITVGAFDNKRRWLRQFIDFFGPTSAAMAVTDASLDAWDNHCLAKRAEGTWKDYFARDVRMTAKEFVRWLSDKGAIPPPTYLSKKSRRFRLEGREIKPWAVEEYRSAVEGSKGRIRLILLLMGNTGLTQGDASDLKDSEVDWEGGYIVRKRSKEKRVKNAPVVRYKLWPSTFALLKQNRSGGPRVIVTVHGTPYVTEKLKDGKRHRKDSFWAAFRFVTARVRKTIPGFSGSPKGVRKLTASLLEEHPAFGKYVQHFLGHAPSSTATRYYVKPSQEQFDEAVLWLGKKLGQIAE